jgi:hypothetical protein
LSKYINCFSFVFIFLFILSGISVNHFVVSSLFNCLILFDILYQTNYSFAVFLLFLLFVRSFFYTYFLFCSTFHLYLPLCLSTTATRETKCCVFWICCCCCFPMPPHVCHGLRGLPPGCCWSVTDFWGWDALEARLRCPDEVDGDIWIWSTRRGLKPKFY